MTITAIKVLSIIISDVEKGGPYMVAMQSYPDKWFHPKNGLQWYIDANWLIKTHSHTYDPTEHRHEYDKDR